MSKEIITDDGRIFKKDVNGYRERRGGTYNESPALDERQFKKAINADLGVKAQDLKDSETAHPQFTNLMFDRSNL